MKLEQFILASISVYLVTLAFGVGFSIYSHSYWPALIMGGLGTAGIIVSNFVIENKKLVLADHAELCPVCNGRGWKMINSQKENCNGCEGKGWIIPKVEAKKEGNILSK